MATESVTYGIGGYDPEHPNGNVIERLIDNGDGTGTRTTYVDGELVATDTVERPLPVDDPPTDPLANLDPAAIRAAVHAGALLVQRAGDLWDALTEISVSNTARPAIEIVTDVALQAALADGEPAP